MRFLSKIIAALAVFFFTVGAQAQVFGSTYTYSGLAWSFSTSQSGFSGCNTLYLDATGDVYQSDNFSTYGQLYCPAIGSYFSSGNAYFDSVGNFNLSVELGVAHKLVCASLSGSTLSGSCSIYNNSGTLTGSAFISFL